MLYHELHNFCHLASSAKLFTQSDFESSFNQGSKSLARIVWIYQAQYKVVYHITHSSIVIGQFRRCEPRISNPAFNCSWLNLLVSWYRQYFRLLQRVWEHISIFRYFVFSTAFRGEQLLPVLSGDVGSCCCFCQWLVYLEFTKNRLFGLEYLSCMPVVPFQYWL
jgi:hypothetical protein